MHFSSKTKENNFETSARELGGMGKIERGVEARRDFAPTLSGAINPLVMELLHSRNTFRLRPTESKWGNGNEWSAICAAARYVLQLHKLAKQ